MRQSWRAGAGCNPVYPCGTVGSNPTTSTGHVAQLVERSAVNACVEGSNPSMSATPDVAQSVEHSVWDGGVEGSSPSIETILKRVRAVG